MTIIQTPLGPIEGLEEAWGHAFLGIHYAQPPLGALRFAPPKPVTSWRDTLVAREFGPSAPQPDISGASALALPVEPTDEDCLVLNVFTPAADNRARPVLFWIHGGGYIVGSGRVYDGAAFVREHDVVVVTINYRMGAPGFMHVGHLDASLGSSVNNGILDQICALEWVRDNILAFGGDPDNVMIFGESAGGTSTAMLMGCPRAEGLFHKAAVHSPHVDLLQVGQAHIEFTNECIRRLGGDPEKDGLDTLRNASINALTQLALPDLTNPNVTIEPTLGLRSQGPVGFSPAIDGALIPAPVFETVAARGSANVPFLGGGCRHEGTLFPTTIGLNDYNEVEAIDLFNRSGCDGNRAMAVYERFAPGSSPREKLVYALTDTMFRNSMVRILDAAADSGAACWSWMCTWETDLPTLRASHAMDLTFLWDWIDNPELGGLERFAGTGAPDDLGRVMRAYWVNFARTGQPGAPGEPEWPQHNTDTRPILILDAQRRIEHRFDDEVRALWFGD